MGLTMGLTTILVLLCSGGITFFVRSRKKHLLITVPVFIGAVLFSWILASYIVFTAGENIGAMDSSIRYLVGQGVWYSLIGASMGLFYGKKKYKNDKLRRPSTVVPEGKESTDKTKLPLKIILLFIVVIIAVTSVVWGAQLYNQRKDAAADGMYRLGLEYKDGYGSHPKDAEKAIQLFKKAARAADHRAYNVLAHIYSDGELVPQDYAEAIKWYRKSAEWGDMDSQHKLGYAYSSGEMGVRQDYVEARKWYMRAAKYGHAPAQFKVGGIHYLGRGVPIDYITAYAWYNIAAAQGNNDANRLRYSAFRGAK